MRLHGKNPPPRPGTFNRPPTTGVSWWAPPAWVTDWEGWFEACHEVAELIGEELPSGYGPIERE